MSRLSLKQNIIKEIKCRRRFNKYSLCALICGVGISSINLINGISSFEEIAYEMELTEFDEFHRKEFLEEQEKNSEGNLVFENKELETLLKKKFLTDKLTFANLKLLHSLEIKELKDTNLSDLKYVTNLEKLTLTDMSIDGKDLEFNQNLKTLTIKEGTLENTFFLPNTITYLELDDSRVIDEEFMVPYQVEKLFLLRTYFNNLHLKNPQNLKEIIMRTFSLFDLEWLKDCSNLKKMNIYHTPNIKNADLLELFIDQAKIDLDDCSPISIPTTTLEKIYANEVEAKGLQYISEGKQLDIIADTLLEDGMTDEEKVCAITLYILRKYEYDMDFDDEWAREYNQKPLYYALNQKEVICINYACMFSSLANRMGLSNYQLFSEEHTWNHVLINGEKRQIDTTFLDYSAVVYPRVPFSTEKIDCYKSIESSAYYLKNGKEDSLIYYLFSEEIAEKTFCYFGKGSFELEGTIINEVIELSTWNENIGYRQEEKPRERDIFNAKISLIFTFLGIALLQNQKRININRLKAEEKKELRKKLRKSN